MRSSSVTTAIQQRVAREASNVSGSMNCLTITRVTVSRRAIGLWWRCGRTAGPPRHLANYGALDAVPEATPFSAGSNWRYIDASYESRFCSTGATSCLIRQPDERKRVATAAAMEIADLRAIGMRARQGENIGTLKPRNRCQCIDNIARRHTLRRVAPPRPGQKTPGLEKSPQ